MLTEKQIEYLNDISFAQFRFNTVKGVYQRAVSSRIIPFLGVNEYMSLKVNNNNLAFSLVREEKDNETDVEHDFNFQEDWAKPEYDVFFNNLFRFVKTMSTYIEDSNLQKLNIIFDELNYNKSERIAKEIISLALTNPKMNVHSEELEFTCRLADEIAHMEISVWDNDYSVYVHTDNGSYYVDNIDSLTSGTKEALNKYLYNLLSCFDGIISSNEFENLLDILKEDY